MTDNFKSDDQNADLLARLETALRSLTEEEANGYYQMLVASDALLKQTIEYLESGTRPPPRTSTLGSVKYGALPYWFKNPDSIPGSSFIPIRFKELMSLFDKFGVIPPPTVTDKEYDCLVSTIKAGKPVISFDGTYWGEEGFEQLNYHWLEAPVNELLARDKIVKPFPNNPKTVSMKNNSDGTIKIAILGDWGTGEPDATNVMTWAMKHSPDYLIHLGDVYYTGTPQLSEDIFWGPDNETNNLVDHWPDQHQQPLGTSFTLNSNHEMYCGGIGYFDDALSSNIFQHQQGTSYFLLQNDDWQIFGLDSAYSTPAALYMEGKLNEHQTNFIKENRDPAKKIILLSHHNAIDVTGQNIVMTGNDSLWHDACSALCNRPPDYWYWGHIHDGVIYCPQDRDGGSTLLRCIGHAGMPYGAPWGLTKAGSQAPFSPADYIDGIEFFAGTPIDAAAPAGQVKNGFAIVTLTGDALTEAMYDNDGNQTWPIPS